MNDTDLRQRLDVLTAKVPAQPDAYGRVQTRAGRIRRRRQAAVAGALAVVAAGAVALPASLAHRDGRSPTGLASASPSASPSATVSPASLLPQTVQPGCTQPLRGRIGSLGFAIQEEYGLRTTVAEVVAWAGNPGLAIAGHGAGSLVDLCLVVGDLQQLVISRPAGAPEMTTHYAVFADSSAGDQLISAASDLPSAPLPGVPASAIVAFRPVPATTAPSPPSASLDRACVSADLVGAAVAVGFPDGTVQGGVHVQDGAATRCRLEGTFALILLDSTGRVIPQKASAVMPKVRVSGTLRPGDPSSFLEVGIYGWPAGPGRCAQKDVTTPETFVITVGTVQLRVRNHASHATTPSVYGCPGTVTADQAQLH
jgi:hypothetical protein